MSTPLSSKNIMGGKVCCFSTIAKMSDSSEQLTCCERFEAQHWEISNTE